MKKLLVLALVLSMATMANAAISLSISGPTQLLVGEVGTYTISHADGLTAGVDVDVVSTLGGITGGAVIAGNRVTAYDVAGINGATSNFELVATNDAPAAILSPLFTFTFASNAAGVAAVSMIANGIFDEAYNDIIADSTLNGINVTIVPEPLTLGLLALGGLFIRRK